MACIYYINLHSITSGVIGPIGIDMSNYQRAEKNDKMPLSFQEGSRSPKGSQQPADTLNKIRMQPISLKIPSGKHTKSY